MGGGEHGRAGIMAAVDHVVSSRACNRTTRRQRARSQVQPSEKEPDCTDIDEVEASTFAPAAIIEEK